MSEPMKEDQNLSEAMPGGTEEKAGGEGQLAEEAKPAENLGKALEEEKAKAERYLANWQRSQADFINFKRRTEQERGEITAFANAMLIASLLPVLDDLERALDNVSAKLAGLTWVDGIQLIYRKLVATLESQGLSRIEALGQPFDPNIHEAVMFAEGEEGKVVEEVQKGYKFNNRLLRPAMVKVGKGADLESKPEGDNVGQA